MVIESSSELTKNTTMQMETKNHKTEEQEWELWEYYRELERQWKLSQPKFTSRELLEIFPEAKKIIPEKITEWKEWQNEMETEIRHRLLVTRQETKDLNTRWFCREWLKVTEGEKLIKIDKQIQRLKHLLFVIKGRQPQPGWITDEMVENAQRVPIENVVEIKLQRMGNKLVGLCPFHNEKHPSFTVYPESNSFYCYGCGEGGNVINLIIKLHGYSFKEAVKWLNNK